MLGYMNKQQAINEGFTHHGSYYGIPLWIAPENHFMVATKWMPMEFVMTIFHHIECFLRPLIYPNEPYGFTFVLKGKIDAP